MASKYWVGDSGNWTNVDTTHWSLTSGGVGGAPVPNSSDDVIFDANSFTTTGQTVIVTTTVTLWTTGVIKSFTSLNVTNNPTFLFTVSQQLLVTGSFTLSGNETFGDSTAGELWLWAGGGLNITTNGTKINTKTLTLGHPTGGGGMDLIDDLSCNYLVINKTTLDTNNFNVSFNSVVVGGSGTINMGNGTWTVNVVEYGFGWLETKSATVNADNSELIFNIPNNIDAFVTTSGARTFYNVTVNGAGETWTTGSVIFHSTLGMTFNSFTIANSPIDVGFGGGQTFTLGTLTANGTATKQIYIYGNGSQATLSAGTVSVSYAKVYRSIAAGVAIPFVNDPGGVDSGENVNWQFGAVTTNDTSIVFQDSTGVETVRIKSAGNANGGFAVLLDSQYLSADRTYSFPNISGNIALLESLSAGAPLSYNNTTGAFSISQATTSTDGYLSQGDWNTFNGKEDPLSFTSPLDRSTDTISLKDLTGFGAAGEVIKTNATTDGLEWGTAGGVPAGNQYNIQFNDGAGAFSGTDDLNWDGYLRINGYISFQAGEARYVGVEGQTVPATPGDDLILVPGYGYDVGNDDGGLKDIEIGTAGTGYAWGDIVDVTGGNNDASVRIDTILGTITSADLGSGVGSGYTVTDIVTIDGGNNDATIEVDSVDGGGGIATFHIVSAGTGYLLNGNTFTLTGVGSGSTLENVNGLGIPQSISIDTEGSGYSVADGLSTTGGTGTGFKVDITEVFAPTAGGMLKIMTTDDTGTTVALSTLELTSDRVATFPDADGTIAVSAAGTGGSGSAGAGKQYVELNIDGVIYKLLHDGTV